MRFCKWINVLRLKTRGLDEVRNSNVIATFVDWPDFTSRSRLVVKKPGRTEGPLVGRVLEELFSGDPSRFFAQVLFGRAV